MFYKRNVYYGEYMRIDGKAIAEKIIERLKMQDTKKFLAVFFVGNDLSSKSFINQKEKLAKTLGVDFRVYHFPEEKATNDSLRKEIGKIVNHKTCGAALVQLPLPEKFNAQYIMNVIPREKDVDVLGERALGAFYAGRNSVLPTAVGVFEEIVKEKDVNLKSMRIAVVGLGPLVGKPISTWLKGKVAELYAFGKGGDFEILKNADIVVCGTGAPKLIKPNMLRENALVIDFGYGMIDGSVSGDFDASAVREPSEVSYTPTPGGTGPILVAKLFENFFELSSR